MQNKTQRIELLYETSSANLGRQTSRWLAQSGIAVPAAPPEKKESGFTHCSFYAVRHIAMDSAIVFVTDEATRNQDWQDHVRALPQDARVIPVGGIEDVDYNDERVLPKCIEEINFILINDHIYENMLDSLVTDPAFYTVKNHLMLRYNCWTLSGSESELLSNRGEIERYTSLISEKLTEEKDEYQKTQLQNILKYLSASRRYAKEVSKGRLLRSVCVIALILGAVAMMVLFYNAVGNLKRATYANIVFSVDMEATTPETSAIKMVEAITNPYTEASARQTAYTRLLQTMDKPWMQTPVGIYYKYTLNDAALPVGSRYVWTGDSGGRVVCWDTYTGTTTVKQKISDDEIVLVAVDQDNTHLAAVDASGVIYRSGGDTWTDAGHISGVSVYGAEMELYGDSLLIYDDKTIELHGENGAVIQELGWGDRTVLSADFLTTGELAAVGEENGVLFRAEIASGGTADIARYPEIQTGRYSVADIYDSVTAVTDADGQVWRIENGAASPTGLMLPMSVDLKLINRQTVIYHERNMGTGLYDIEESFDYGDVLAQLRGIDRLWATEEMVAAESGSVLGVMPIKDVLRADDTAAAGADAVYDQKKSALNLKAGVTNAEILENGTIRLEMVIQDEEEAVTVLMDPALVLSNSAGYTSSRDIELLPEEFFQYQNEAFTAEGPPTVIGLRYEEANELNSAAGCYILIGCADGLFVELFVTPEDGAGVPTRLHRIPSRCGIAAIYEADGGYLLEDCAGRLWHCESGVNMITEKGCIAAVKNKLHTAVTTELKEGISKEVWRGLDLQIYPGGDRKEWE